MEGLCSVLVTHAETNAALPGDTPIRFGELRAVKRREVMSCNMTIPEYNEKGQNHDKKDHHKQFKNIAYSHRPHPSYLPPESNCLHPTCNICIADPDHSDHHVIGASYLRNQDRWVRLSQGQEIESTIL
jgi:hypothetical protein